MKCKSLNTLHRHKVVPTYHLAVDYDSRIFAINNTRNAGKVFFPFSKVSQHKPRFRWWKKNIRKKSLFYLIFVLTFFLFHKTKPQKNKLFLATQKYKNIIKNTFCWEKFSNSITNQRSTVFQGNQKCYYVKLVIWKYLHNAFYHKILFQFSFSRVSSVVFVWLKAFLIGFLLAYFFYYRIWVFDKTAHYCMSWKNNLYLLLPI